jgi:hypothetical protein
MFMLNKMGFDEYIVKTHFWHVIARAFFARHMYRSADAVR